MRILVLSQYYIPDVTAAAFRLSETAELLARSGADVVVLTSVPHKSNVQAPAAHEELTSVRVERSKLKPLTGTGTKAYLFHYLSYVYGTVARGARLWARGWTPDVILASSPPLFVGLAARVLSLLMRRPFVLDVRDIWPDSAVAVGQFSETSRAFRIGKILERYLYNKAAAVTCVSEPMKAYIATRSDVPCSVVYNGILEQHLANDDRSAPSAPVVDRQTILYAGNIGRAQDLGILVTAFSRLLADSRISGWRVVMIGDGAEIPRIADMIRAHQLEHLVQLQPSLAKREVLPLMRRAGLLFLNLRSHPAFAKTVPSKVFDYMATERPIIAGLEGASRAILEQLPCNICLPAGDLEALVDALERATRTIHELEASAWMNQAAVRQRYTREAATEVLKRVLAKVVTSGRTRPHNSISEYEA